MRERESESEGNAEDSHAQTHTSAKQQCVTTTTNRRESALAAAAAVLQMVAVSVFRLL